MQIPFHAAVIVGPMSFGKTTWVCNKIGEAYDYLLRQGIDEDQILMLHTKEMNFIEILQNIRDLDSKYDLRKIKYFYLFNDDAPAAEGQLGRRAYSEANIKTSKKYIMIRHILRKMEFSGALIVFHATQVYHLLDVTFRRTAKLHLFKDYPNEPADAKLIGPLLGKGYFRQLFKITLKVTMPRNKRELIEGLSSAVAVFAGRWRFIAIADEYRLPKNYVVLESKSVNNIIKRKKLQSPPPTPEVKLKEFSEILRKYGIKGRNENFLKAYREIMEKLGYRVRRDLGNGDVDLEEVKEEYE